VKVRVLGSAAGGGVPQWNCSCANCAAARAGRQPRRTQCSVALSADGERWLLLNCSPDVATQIESFAPLQPAVRRGTPIAGMLFTDANVDHIGGLTVLRQQGPQHFYVRSTAIVKAIALAQPAFAPFAWPPHRWIEVPLDGACEAVAGDDLVGNDLIVRAIAVDGTTPGYDGRRDVRGAVVAYEISTPSSPARLLFAPVFRNIHPVLRDAVARAAVAFLDGTFYTDEELLASGLISKHARALGHQAVADGTLQELRDLNTRIIFIHVNNSNPMLDTSSAAYANVREGGAEIAYDSMQFEI
jgi:pyrroloquinoline quinone biosynthesis protein B